MITFKCALSTGIIAAFLSVAFGAFGAHALKAKLTPDMLQIWQTAVLYQFFHALALILLGIWMKQTNVTTPWICGAFALGIILFSGSLYTLALTGIKGFGAVTPVGGLAFLVGWALWLIALYSR